MILDNDPLGIRSIDIKYEGSTRATQYCIDDFMKRLYGSDYSGAAEPPVRRSESH